jgi:Spy/CpxP family protein refolding chaperone
MFFTVILALSSALTFAQQKPGREPQRQEVQLGRGMSLIAPGLMQIGSETNFFLLIADQIRLTEEQRATLEEIVFEFQKYSVQKLADLNVADAELERLLTRDKIDLDAVRAKVKEIEAINTEVKMRRIESLLKAINTLTHEQHLKIVTLVREIPAPGARPQPERAQE